MVRASIAVLAATLALLAAAGAADADPVTLDARLLARYAPALVLHPQEMFAPVPVDGFLADSDLLAKDASGAWAPLASSLAAAPAGSRLDQRTCDAIDGPAATPCYAGAQAAHPSATTTYGAVFRTPTHVALQYWLFYPFNGWSPTVPAGSFWQAHEGDWEAVTVLLDRREQPQLVGLTRHCGGIARAWSRTPRLDGRPVVWVSIGSHANGFGPGVVAQDRRCWPDVALAVYDAYKQLLVDHAARGRTLTPRVISVRATQPAWMRFPGSWGGDQYVGFPEVAPFRFGAGPKGPAFHELWRRPVALPLSWPRR